MIDLLPSFKAVSLIFAISAVATGAQAIINPIGFSRGFGLVLNSTPNPSINNENKISHSHEILTKSYISLMGVRQIATGIILLTFAYQDKWTEMATILAIIGVVVAGTDGVYLARGGTRNLGLFHAIPGALIAALACFVIYSNP